MWQYTDSTEKVVFRINSDGSMESHMVTIDIIQKWIADGNTPLPAPNNS